MMKKRILTIVAALTMAVTPSMAQIFMDDDEFTDDRVQKSAEDFGVMVPAQEWDVDQWKITPIGEGLALLTGLGVAYLLGKRKKDE